MLPTCFFSFNDGAPLTAVLYNEKTLRTPDGNRTKAVWVFLFLLKALATDPGALAYCDPFDGVISRCEIGCNSANVANLSE